MAQQNLSGLFSGASEADIRKLMQRENKAEANAAYANTKGDIFAQLAAKGREENIQGFRQLGGLALGAIDKGFGLGGDLVAAGEDPRLGKARKREGDKQIIMQKLGEFNNDGEITQEEYKEGHAMLMSRGYPEEAQKWLAMSQSVQDQEFKARGLDYEGDRVNISRARADLERHLGMGNLSLGERSQKLKELAESNGMEVNWAELGLKEKDLGLKKSIFIAQQAFKEKSLDYQKEIDKVNTKLKERGLKINEDGVLIDRMKAEAGVDQGQQNIDLSKLALGLRTQIQTAREAFQNKTFDWEKKQDELNNDLKQQGLNIRVEGNNISRLTAEAGIDLGKKKLTLAQESQVFNQGIETSKLAVTEMLANNKVYVDGEQIEQGYLGLEQRREIAQQDHELRTTIGLGNLKHKAASLKVQKFATEQNIALKHRGANLSEKQQSENMELLRNTFDWKKQFQEETLQEGMKQRFVDTQLTERRIELQEKGIDLNDMRAGQRQNLAVQMFAEDKLMNIHKMDEAEQNRFLTEKLAGYANQFKSQGLDVQRMGLSQKKEMFKEKLKHDAKMANLAARAKIGAASITAGAPDPTTYKAPIDNDLSALESYLSATPGAAKKYGVEGTLWGTNDDKVRTLAAEINGWIAQKQGRNMTDFFNQGSESVSDPYRHAKKGPKG